MANGNTLQGCAAPSVDTQISSSISRLYRAIEVLESNTVDLGDRIGSVLRSDGNKAASESVEPACDCPLAETLASLARRVELTYGALNNFRQRVEL